MAIRGLGKVAGGFVSSTIRRLSGAGLEPGGDSALNTTSQARWSDASSSTDWRVSLTVPSGSSLRSSKNDIFSGPIMDVLSETGGVIFPLTPSIIIQHQAAYSAMAQVHNNYPFYAYQNSETSSLTVIGEFPVQNSRDAEHWVATLHFFRTMTKMFFGKDQNLKGSPPPVLKLNGYGEYVFKNVPVVITSFSCELTQGVDYISTGRQDDRLTADLANAAKEFNIKGLDEDSVDEAIQAQAAKRKPGTWAPTSSIFTVQVQPIYSRSSLTNFSLQDFARGGPNTHNVGGDQVEGFSFI